MRQRPFCSILCSMFAKVSLNIIILPRGFKDVFEAFLLAALRALSFLKITFFGSRSTGILVKWPVRLRYASLNKVCTLCILAFLRTSVICHLFLRVFSGNLSGNDKVPWHNVSILSRSHMDIKGLAVPLPYRHSV